MPDDAREDRSARRRRWVEIGVTSLWMLNVGLLVGACVWVLLDGRFGQAVSAATAQLMHLVRGGERALQPELGYRVAGLLALASAGLVTLLAIAAALVVGPARHRGVRSWLALTAVVAGWLGLLTAWPDLAWQGKQWRLARQLAAFEPTADVLRKSWPDNDGQLPEVGAFMAYPQPRPTMLLMLTPPAGRPAENRYSAIERSPAGALRFELTGDESGDWLEWHPAGSEPASFIGGLQGDYQLLRSAALGDGWYATRYRVAELPIEN